MKNTLLETGFIKALLEPLCSDANWMQLYENYETKLQELTTSTYSTIDIIRRLDRAIAELTAIRACHMQKKYALLHH